MHKQWFFLSLVLVILFVSICACTSTAQPRNSTPASTPTASMPPSPTQLQTTTSSGTFALMVNSLNPGTVLPDTYTCMGASEAPPVSWLNVPTGTRSLVLVLDDPDAPAGTFTHWIVYNIPPGVREIPRAGLDAGLRASGVCEGRNSAGSTGYTPPCPPSGKPHRYIFTLYAADMVLPQVTVDRAAINEALAGHTLGQAQVVTIFWR